MIAPLLIIGLNLGRREITPRGLELAAGSEKNPAWCRR
jgi:hypothetical protein